MDVNTAVTFLREHQPLPDDEALNELPDVMTTYDETREYFLENPDPVCIKLFLHSFGQGSGYGMYQIIENVLWAFEPGLVVPELVDALEFGPESTLFWNAQICSSFPDARLTPVLSKLLNHNDSDIRWATVMALEQIGGSEVFNVLLQRLLIEEDEEVTSFLEEALRDMPN
jgi:hypothetical protein